MILRRYWLAKSSSAGRLNRPLQSASEFPPARVEKLQPPQFPDRGFRAGASLGGINFPTSAAATESSGLREPVSSPPHLRAPCKSVRRACGRSETSALTKSSASKSSIIFSSRRAMARAGCPGISANFKRDTCEPRNQRGSEGGRFPRKTHRSCKRARHYPPRQATYFDAHQKFDHRSKGTRVTHQ